MAFSGSRTCANCQKNLDRNSPPVEYLGENYCFNCFRDIKKGKAMPFFRQGPTPVKIDHRHCSYCGKPKRIGEDRCNGCGVTFLEEEMLTKMSIPPQIPGNANETTLSVADYTNHAYKSLLPVVPVNIALYPEETCSFYCKADLTEDRKGDKRSIFNGNFQNLKKIDTGNFYITTKRVIFIGKKKNININLDEIINSIVYTTAIELVINGIKDPIFMLHGNIGLAKERIEISLRQHVK